MAFDMDDVFSIPEDNSFYTRPFDDVFSVPEDNSFYTRPGWYCDFYYGYGIDVLEEDAVNEKCCIQVLRILIAKADTEIDELEKNLVFLQSELAWAESEEWAEICSNTLREKIDCLSTSITTLKSKDKNDEEVHLSRYTPAESLHDILKTLLRDFFQEKDKQNELPLDVVVLDSSGTPGLATKLLEENTEFINSDSTLIAKEDTKESNINPAENGTISMTPLMLEEKKTNNAETVEPANTLVKVSSPLSLKLEADHDDEKKILNSFDVKSAREDEAKEHDFAAKDNLVVQSRSYPETVNVQPANTLVKVSSPLSLKLEADHDDEKKILNSFDVKSAREDEAKEHDFAAKDNLVVQSRSNPETVNVQPTDIILKNSGGNALKHAVCYSSTKENLSTSGAKLISAEVNENSCDSNLMILDTSLIHMESGPNPGNTVKLVNTFVEDLGSNACRHETDHNNSTAATSVSPILNSSLNPEGGGNPPITEMAANAIVQNISAGALRHACGLGRRNDSDSGLLATSSQAEGENSDIGPDASRHATGLGGRTNSDSRWAKGGNSDIGFEALRHTTGHNGRNNLNSCVATSRQLKVRNYVINHAALRPATHINQSRNSSNSSLGTFSQAKGGICDLDRKLCDIPPNAARKQGIKESNFTQAGKTDSLYPSEAEWKKKLSQQILEVKKTGLTDTENSALTSLLELQDEKGKDTTKEQPAEGKMQQEEVLMVVTAANDKEFVLGLSVTPQKPKAKKKESNKQNAQEPVFLSSQMQQEKAQLAATAGIDKKLLSVKPQKQKAKKIVSNPQNVQEPVFLSSHMQHEVQLAATAGNNEKLSVKPQKQKAKKTVSNQQNVQEPVFVSSQMVSDSSSVSEVKKPCKSGLGSDSSSSNQSSDRKIKKKIVLHGQCKALEHNTDIRKSSSSTLVEINGSTLQLNSNPHRNSNDSAAKDDLFITGCHAIVPWTEARPSLPSATSKLKRKKMDLNDSAGNKDVLSITESHAIVPWIEIPSAKRKKIDLKDSAGKNDIWITECNEIVHWTGVMASSDYHLDELKNMKVCQLKAIAKEQKLVKFSKLKKDLLIERIVAKQQQLGNNGAVQLPDNGTVQLPDNGADQLP